MVEVKERIFFNGNLNKKEIIGDYFQDIIVKTKGNGNEYVYDKKIKAGNIREMDNRMGFLVRYKRKDADLKRYFLFVRMEDGIFITDQIRKGRLTTLAIDHYRRIIGQAPIEAEKQFRTELLETLRNTFEDCEVQLFSKVDDSMRLKLKDPRTKKEYIEVCGSFKNMPNVRPDFIAKEINGKRTYFIEAEHSFHDEKDFIKKLMKYHMLGRRVYFLFNGEDSLEYHMEIVEKFRRMTGRRFDRLHYATIEKVQFFGKDAFIKY